MSVLDHALRYTIYGMVIVLLGFLIGDLCNRNKDQTPDPVIAALEPKSVEMLQAMPPNMALQTNPPKEKSEPYREKLKHYETFRSRVLLKGGEAAEKQRLLANVKPIQWIESQLSASKDFGTETLGEHLTMIDFLEDSLTWKENPARTEALDSLERALKTNNLSHGSKETKQMIAGDKMELFAILTQEEPSRAKDLLERTEDKQLLNVFQYAIKRLALKKLAGEEQ